MKKDSTLFKMFVNWKSEEAKKELIERKLIHPIPKKIANDLRHALHAPDECIKCAIKDCGIFKGTFYFLKRKKHEKNLKNHETLNTK